MKVPCDACGAELRLNPKLKGTQVSCPQCGARMTVPERAPAPREPAPAPPRRAAPEKPRTLKKPARVTLWLLAAQGVLGALGVSCLIGAFFSGWKPPDHTYFRMGTTVLFLAGAGLLVAGWLAHYLPVITTLLSALFVIGACADAYRGTGVVDASRALALSAAMLALWLALQHRRSIAY